MNGCLQSMHFLSLLHPSLLLMDGVFTNSSALHHTVRDVAKTQDLSDVTLTRLIKTQPEIFANMHSYIGEMKSYVVLLCMCSIRARQRNR